MSINIEIQSGKLVFTDTSTNEIYTVIPNEDFSNGTGVNAEAVPHKIARAYVKVAGAGGLTKMYGPVPFSQSMDDIIFSPMTDAANVVEDITLKDMLLAKRNGEGQIDGHYPFDANSTSFMQLMVDTRHNWEHDFFGIYMPDIESNFNIIIDKARIFCQNPNNKLKITLYDLTSQEIINITNILSSIDEIQYVTEEDEIFNFNIENWTQAESTEIDIQTDHYITNTNLLAPVKEIRIGKSVDVYEASGTAENPTYTLITDRIGRWEYTTPAGSYLGSFLTEGDLERLLLIPYIDSNGTNLGWRHVASFENLSIKYDISNDTKISLWQALVESENIYNVIECESYIGATHYIASQDEIVNLIPPWTDLILPEKESTSANQNKFITLQGLKDYDRRLRAWVPIEPGDGNGSMQTPWLFGDGWSANEVSGDRSFALGRGNKVSNWIAGAIGQGLNSPRNLSLTIGEYNDPVPNSYFEIGTGSSDTERQTAFRVLKNGNEPKTLVYGSLEVYNPRDNNNWIVSVNAYPPDKGKTFRGYTQLNGGEYTGEGEEYGNILRFANTCGFGLSGNTDQYFKIWSMNDGPNDDHVCLIPSKNNVMDLGWPDRRFRNIQTNNLYATQIDADELFIQTDAWVSGMLTADKINASQIGTAPSPITNIFTEAIGSHAKPVDNLYANNIYIGPSGSDYIHFDTDYNSNNDTWRLEVTIKDGAYTHVYYLNLDRLQNV